MKPTATLVALAMALPMQASAKPGSVFPGVPAGQIGRHTCKATYQGRPLFAGSCMVNTKGGETMVFSPKDGCTFTLRPASPGVTGELSAYRQECALDPATGRELDENQTLGAMHPSGACWTGGGAQICVTP